MRVDVIMPQMGESIQEGTLTRWMKKVGEPVKRDEPIFEISTDKVDAEIPAPNAGVLAEIKVTEGMTVPINTVVAVIETEASAAAGAPKPSAAAAGASQPSAAVAAPRERTPAAAADTGRSGQAGARVSAQGAPSQALAAGVAPSGIAARTGVQPPPQKPRADMSPEELRRTRSSPVVRKIATEHGIDISMLEGTGLSGRVTKKDILGALESGLALGPGRPAPPPPAGAATPWARPEIRPAAPTAPQMPPVPAFAPGERVQRIPMTVMRKKIAEHMVLSRRTSAHVTTVFDVDFSRVEALRREKGAAFLDRNGVKLTYMPFIAKAAVDCLMAFPILNASVDGEDIVYKKDINLGIAVALDWGLIVPVVRNAQDLSISGLAKAIVSVAERARTKKLSPDEVQGGTFTITNPGVFGGLFGTPIINQPQVAILGVGTIEKRVVVIDDAIAIHSMCYLALSFDHRLIDGAVADQFMADLKGRLQEFDGATV